MKKGSILDGSELASMAHAMAGEKDDLTKNTERLISNAAARRIMKLAGARRVSKDIAENFTDAVHHDKYGIVHKIFRDNLDELTEKALFITTGKKMKTLLPRHVQQLGLILGLSDEDEGVKLAMAPIKRRVIQRSAKGLRLNPEALRLLVAMTLDRTVRHLRSGVGIAAHENDRLTVRARDVQNAQIICENFPQ